MVARRDFLKAGLLIPSVHKSVWAAPRGPRIAGLDILPGNLLLATPQVRGDAFSKSVVLVLKHNTRGSQGLILNQSMAVPVRDTMPEIAGLMGAGEPIFYGGPVAPESVRVLVETTNPEPGSIVITERMAMVNDMAILRRVLGRNVRPQTRFLVGYAGWEAGQLVQELLRGDWTLLQASTSALFTTPPTELWQTLKIEAMGQVALRQNIQRPRAG